MLDYETFCVCNLGSKPAPEQKQVAEAYDKYSFLLVLMSRQSGKTWTVASKTLHYALNHPNKRILVFAPAKDQAVDILFGRLKSWIEGKQFLMDLVKDDGFGKKRLFVDYVEFSNGSSIRCLSASEKSNIVGFTGDVIILDECQNISDLVVYQRIEPMLGSIENPKYIKIGCVAQDTLVLTDKGYEKIGSIDSGIEEHKRVLVGKEDIKVSTHMVSNPEFYVLNLVTRSGYNITATPNHKLFDGNNWKMISEFKVGDYIPIIKSKPKFEVKDDIDDNLAYLLGLYIGDGNIERKIHRMTITSFDKEVQDWLLGYGFRKSSEGHYRLNSKRLIDFIESLGFLFVKAKYKIIPDSVFKFTEKHQELFLRGMFDADGCCLFKRNKYAVCKYTSTSEKLIDTLMILLLNHGIISNKYVGVSKPTNKVKVYSTSYNLEIYGKYSKLFLDKIGFMISRKNKVFKSDKFVDKIPFDWKELKGNNRVRSKYGTFKRQKTMSTETMREFLSLYPNEKYINILNKDYYWDKVEYVTWTKAKTSDFCLDGDHSYIANGFIVHNTPRGRNQFYESWKEGKAGNIWHVEEYPWQKCTRLNKNLIDSFKRSNPYFKTEYELEWMNNITSFFTRQELEDLFYEYDLGYYENMFKETRGNKVFDEVYCGIDWGSVKDRTEVWFLGNEGGKIKTLGVYEMMGNYREQIKDIISLLKIYNPLVTYMDATGSTTRSFGDMLEGIGYVIEGIQMSNKYKATELYDNLKRIVSYRLIEIPKKEEIVKQFYELELHQSTTAASFNKVQAPSNGHDDHTDACALACLGFVDMVSDITSKMAYIDNKLDKDTLNDPFIDVFTSYNYKNDPDMGPSDKYYYKSGTIDLIGD